MATTELVRANDLRFDPAFTPLVYAAAGARARRLGWFTVDLWGDVCYVCLAAALGAAFGGLAAACRATLYRDGDELETGSYGAAERVRVATGLPLGLPYLYGLVWGWDLATGSEVLEAARDEWPGGGPDAEAFLAGYRDGLRAANGYFRSLQEFPKSLLKCARDEGLVDDPDDFLTPEERRRDERNYPATERQRIFDGGDEPWDDDVIEGDEGPGMDF